LGREDIGVVGNGIREDDDDDGAYIYKTSVEFEIPIVDVDTCNAIILTLGRILPGFTQAARDPLLPPPGAGNRISYIITSLSSGHGWVPLAEF
jgi:hypothetical protein